MNNTYYQFSAIYQIDSFPKAISYHQSDGLKHKSLFSYHAAGWKSKVGATGLKSRCQQDVLPLEVLGANLVLASLAPGDSQHSLACGHITPNLSTWMVRWPSLLWESNLCLPFIENIYYVWSTKILRADSDYMKMCIVNVNHSNLSQQRT